MERKYKSVCKDYNCRAKVYTKMNGSLNNRIGNSNLLIMFTNTVSHKMVQNALNELKGKDVLIEHCPSSSISSLKRIFEKHSQKGGVLCQMR